MTKIESRLRNLEVTFTLLTAMIDNFMPPEQQKELEGVMKQFLNTTQTQGHDVLITLNAMAQAQAKLLEPTPTKIIMPDDHLSRH